MILNCNPKRVFRTYLIPHVLDLTFPPPFFFLVSVHWIVQSVIMAPSVKLDGEQDALLTDMGEHMVNGAEMSVMSFTVSSLAGAGGAGERLSVGNVTLIFVISRAVDVMLPIMIGPSVKDAGS